MTAQQGKLLIHLAQLEKRRDWLAQSVADKQKSLAATEQSIAEIVEALEQSARQIATGPAERSAGIVEVGI